MEDYLPIVLALAAAVISGMSKKKKKKPAADVPVEKPEVPSPWDDLMRELSRAETRETPQPVTGRAEGSDPEDGMQEYRPSDPDAVQGYFGEEEDEVQGYEEIPQPGTPVFSYDEEAVGRPGVSSFPADVPSVARAVASAAVAPEQASVSESDGTYRNTSGFFPGGFDPRQAVVYAEIMRPRYMDF